MQDLIEDYLVAVRESTDSFDSQLGNCVSHLSSADVNEILSLARSIDTLLKRLHYAVCRRGDAESYQVLEDELLGWIERLSEASACSLSAESAIQGHLSNAERRLDAVRTESALQDGLATILAQRRAA
jgi:hypothetical protein